MTDKISIKIENLEVQLPASHIIVEKEEYLNMKKKASAGQYMTLNDVLEMVSVSRPWLLENVLYRADIRSKIDIEKNKDGFVKYPKNQGGRYIFLASKTRAFFEQYFSELLREKWYNSQDSILVIVFSERGNHVSFIKKTRKKEFMGL